jgi:hypothetical protein
VISRDDAYTELSLLTSKDGPLNAAEERRRSWLVRRLHEMDETSGADEVAALQSAWDERDPGRASATIDFDAMPRVSDVAEQQEYESVES